MQIVTQAVDTSNVRRTTSDGTEYVVAPVVLLRSMWLNGPPGESDVYVPESEVEASVDRWSGVPVPIDHPTHNQEPISVHDNRASMPVVAETRNPIVVTSNGKQAVAAELWLDIEAAKQSGNDGERILNRLLNGDAVEVSSAYIPQQVVAGEFDGEHRDRAAIGLQPDHVAVLPNEKGKCSLSDGCGAGAPVAPVANQLLVQWTDDPDPGEDGTTGSDTESMTELEHELGDTLSEDDKSLLDKVLNYLSNQPETESEVSTESGTTAAESATDQPQMTDLTDESMIEELAQNTSFDRENLEAWDETDCLQNLYDDYVANQDESGAESGSAEQTTEQPISVDDIVSALEDRGFATTSDIEDALAANEQQERKTELVEHIAANTDRDPETLESLDVNALEILADELPQQAVANYMAQTGARPSPSTTDGSAGFSPVASAHAELAESDD